MLLIITKIVYFFAFNKESRSWSYIYMYSKVQVIAGLKVLRRHLKRVDLEMGFELNTSH